MSIIFSCPYRSSINSARDEKKRHSFVVIFNALPGVCASAFHIIITSQFYEVAGGIQIYVVVAVGQRTRTFNGRTLPLLAQLQLIYFLHPVHSITIDVTRLWMTVPVHVQVRATLLITFRTQTTTACASIVNETLLDVCGFSK